MERSKLGAAVRPDLSGAETWHGTTWALQSAAAPNGSEFTYLFSVTCGQASPCTAVGNSDGGTAVQATLAETGPPVTGHSRVTRAG